MKQKNINVGDMVTIVGILPFTSTYSNMVGKRGEIVYINNNRVFPLDAKVGDKIIPLLYDHIKKEVL